MPRKNSPRRRALAKPSDRDQAFAWQSEAGLRADKKGADADDDLEQLLAGDDEELFSRAMSDVQPMQQERRVSKAVQQADAETLKARREAASAEAASVYNPLSDHEVEMLDPFDELSYKRPGIQHGVFKNLRLGKYNIDARIDLHEMTVERARDAVLQFIKDCLEHDIRCALITHGKGEGRLPQQARLKSFVNAWLPQIEAVQAYHSAQRHHGGYGATYLLLRKSDKEKQKTRQQHSLR